MSWLIEPRCCPRSGCVAGAGVEGSSLFLVWGMGRMGTSGHLCRLRALPLLPTRRWFGPALKAEGFWSTGKEPPHRGWASIPYFSAHFNTMMVAVNNANPTAASSGCASRCPQLLAVLWPTHQASPSMGWDGTSASPCAVGLLEQQQLLALQPCSPAAPQPCSPAPRASLPQRAL